MIEVFDFDQGSDDWFTARLGLPTASEFHCVLAEPQKGKPVSLTRRTYLYKLAGEIITGQPKDDYTNAHMERGKVLEDEARSYYAFKREVECERIGFIKNGRVGASPDSLIGNDGGLEIKTALAHIQIERILRGELPAEHKAQVQGNIFVSEREWWDFASYCPSTPLFVVRVFRDDVYCKRLSEKIDAFLDELDQTVERVRRYGAPVSVRDQLSASLELEPA